MEFEHSIYSNEGRIPDHEVIFDFIFRQHDTLEVVTVGLRVPGDLI